MKFLAILPFLLLAATVASNPVSREENGDIDEDFYQIGALQYTSQHDIVRLLVPLNKMNFEDDEDDDTESENDDVTLFFVEADVNDKGEKEYKGLYSLKNGKAKKVLENGRDAAALNDDSKIVYFGASDGIYTYNGKDGKTAKYGTLNDGIIQIEADNQTGVIYFLTEDHQLYSVADEGTKKEKVEQVVDAQEVAIDYLGNIYFYNSAKEVYVYNTDGLKKFDSATKLNSVTLIRPMFILDDGVLAVLDDIVYILYSNGTIDSSDVKLTAKPTAYAPEATLLQYFAYDKKIYGFNILELLTQNLTEFKKFLEDNEEEIKTIATKSRSSF